MAPAGARGADEADGAGERGRPDARDGESLVNRAVMDRIAAPFDETRQEPWAPVVDFLHTLPSGARVLDLAGGNGRHSRPASDVGLRPVLLDVSHALARIAGGRARGSGRPVEVVEGDALDLPFASGVFDGAVFAAGLHCIRGRGSRLRALGELRRVLRPGALALITVWSSEQERFRSIVSGQRRAEMTDALTADMEVGDVLVPWSKGLQEPVQRFFHVYSEGELRRELEDAGLMVERIEAVNLTGAKVADNWFATVRA